jgi:hypothetical protein
MELPQLQNFQTFQDMKIIQDHNNQIQQQQHPQVQQLTFNGQPAIFIPCSAYNSQQDLLSQIQMLMNSNNNNNNNNNQVYEMVQSQDQQQYQIQLGGNNNNNNQFATLLSNGNNNNNGSKNYYK